MSEAVDRPLIIIGAARSGTNMLRDVLTTLPGVDTWPCDEIPYIWRHGNRGWPDDEFGRELARPAVAAFIRGAFARQAGPHTRLLVEKTCANSLRPGFVDAVLPEARFLVILRNGPDAVASAMQRWRSGFDLGYSLAKARFVPPADLPWYGMRYLGNRLRRLASGERRLGVWGPVFRGMRELPADIPLAELAARQWVRCVERTDADLADVAPHRVHRVRYEDFVAAPARELAGILDFLDLPVGDADQAAAVAGVRTSSVGKAARSLDDRDHALVGRLTGPLLGRHGYAAPEPRP